MSEIIPFGKYKGKPILEVISQDKQYIDWLMLQNWLSEELRSQINVFITHGGKSCEETPEHNRIQAMFLEEDFREKMSTIIKEGTYPTGNPHFEFPMKGGVCDVVLELKDYQVRREVILCSKCVEKTKGHKVKIYEYADRSKCWDCGYSPEIDKKEKAGKTNKFHNKRLSSVDESGKNHWGESVEEIENSREKSLCEVEKKIRTLHEVEKQIVPRKYAAFIEIKPSVGDDYPAVIRQCARTFEFDWDMMNNPFLGKVRAQILLYEKFDSKHVTEEQFKKMFSMSNIKCIRLDEVTK